MSSPSSASPTETRPVDVQLLIATGCAHCPAVLQALSELVKEGLVGRLEVVNIVSHPEVARQLGVRAVPWLQIGPFTLQGMYSPGELRRWVERAAAEDGVADYLGELIESRQLEQALQALRAHPEWNETLLGLVSDLETPIGVRIGVGAMLEELAEQGELAPFLPGLRKLLQSDEAPVRADAAYYLGLSGDPAVRTWLEPLRQDPSPEVREIATEALEALPPPH